MSVRPAAVLGPIYVSTFLTWMAYALVAVTLPFRFQALGFGVDQYGAVVAAFAAGMLLTEGLWGALAHRVARHSAVLALGAVVAVAFVALPFLGAVWEWALVYGGLGALTVFAIPLVRWLAFSAWGPGTGSAGTGRYAVFPGAGLVVGAALGTVLYEATGFVDLCLIAALVWLVGNGALHVIPWETIGVAAPGEGVAGRFRHVLSRRFLVVAALVAILYTCTTLTSNFLQYYSVALFGGSPTAAGFVIAGARAASLLAGFVLGPFIDRWGPPRSAPVGFLLLAVGALATFGSRSYAEMVASTLVLATGAGWLTAGLLPLALRPTPQELQSTAIGVYGSFEDLGQIVGPVVIGAAYAGFGPSSIFLAVALIASGGTVTALALASRDRRSNAAGPRPT